MLSPSVLTEGFLTVAEESAPRLTFSIQFTATGAKGSCKLLMLLFEPHYICRLLCSHIHSMFTSFYKLTYHPTFCHTTAIHHHQTINHTSLCTMCYFHAVLEFVLSLNPLLFVFHRLRHCLCLCYYFSVVLVSLC